MQRVLICIALTRRIAWPTLLLSSRCRFCLCLCLSVSVSVSVSVSSYGVGIVLYLAALYVLNPCLLLNLKKVSHRNPARSGLVFF